MNRRLSKRSTLPAIRCFLLYNCREHSTNHPFLCKTKPNLLLFSLKTMISRKNKPNSNPIQSQFNPKQTQLKPIQTQFKPKFIKVYPREVQTWFYYRRRAAYLARNRGPIYLKGALKDKNNDVIILRIEMKNGLLRISK